MNCRTCGKSEDDGRLQKCPMCHAHFCDDHAYVIGGRWFCSQACGRTFFFDEGEDD